MAKEYDQTKGHLASVTTQLGNNHNKIESQARESQKLQSTIDLLSKEKAKLEADSAANLAAERSVAKAQMAVRVSETNTLILEANKKLSLVRKQRDAAKLSAEQYSNQLQSIFKSDGRVWETPCVNPPAFVPRGPEGRRAAIIAVVNLKGGVGKTTVSARLGATLAQTSQVLAIDLDYQHSLSDLCLTAAQWKLTKQSGRFIENVFASERPSADRLLECIQLCDKSALQIVPSDERLAEIEQQVMAKWMVAPDGPDARFLLRSSLHDPQVSSKFDWIILDCPPRLTTACVNAIAAADYVIIPVLLEPTSASAVPRILKWLRTWKSGRFMICPNLEVLGVMPNKTRLSTRLTKTEDNIRKSQLPSGCHQSWGIEVPFFPHPIWQSQKLTDNAHSKKLLSCSDDLDAVFRDTVNHIRKQVPVYERA